MFSELGWLFSVLAGIVEGSLNLCGPPREFSDIFNYISNLEGLCPDSSLREDLLIHPWHDGDPKR